jgi:hypothetical protein
LARRSKVRRPDGAAPRALTGPGMLRDVSLTLALSGAFLVLAEVCLRFAGVNYEGSFYRLDRNIGYALRPHAEGWNVKEQETYVKINSQGLRDREHALERPANVIRIAVVGDSFSEAKEVDQDATYWSVMERELNRLLPPGSPRIEVINFGTDGYGLSQEYLVLKEKVWRYDPQIILLSGTLHSFVLHSSRKFGTVSAEGPVPFFVRSDEGLVLDRISRQEQRAFVPASRMSELFADSTNSSRVLALMNTVRRQLAKDASDLEKRRQGSSVATLKEVKDTENAVLRGPADPDLDEAWQISEGLIRLAHAEAGAHHAELWLVLLDMAPQVDPDPARRAAVMRTLGIDDLFVGDKLFAGFADREGIKHAMVAPAMLEYAQAHRAVLHGFAHRPRNSGHWNEIGHQAAGGIIAARLLGCSDVIRAHLPSAAGPGAACAEQWGQ